MRQTSNNRRNEKSWKMKHHKVENQTNFTWTSSQNLWHTVWLQKEKLVSSLPDFFFTLVMTCGGEMCANANCEECCCSCSCNNCKLPHKEGWKTLWFAGTLAKLRNKEIHRQHFLCFPCKRGWKAQMRNLPLIRGADNHRSAVELKEYDRQCERMIRPSTCGLCQTPATPVGPDCAVPNRTDVKEWARLAARIADGETFQKCRRRTTQRIIPFTTVS